MPRRSMVSVTALTVCFLPSSVTAALPNTWRTDSQLSFEDVPTVQFEARRPFWRFRVPTVVAPRGEAAQGVYFDSVSFLQGQPSQQQEQQREQQQPQAQPQSRQPELSLTQAMAHWRVASAQAAAAAAVANAAAASVTGTPSGSSLDAAHGSQASILVAREEFAATVAATASPSIVGAEALAEGAEAPGAMGQSLEQSAGRSAAPLADTEEATSAEAAKIRSEDEILRSEVASLKHTNAALRMHDAVLRIEDNRLRTSLASLTRARGAALHEVTTHFSKGAIIVMGSVTALLIVCFLAFYNGVDDDDDWIEDDDDEEVAVRKLRLVVEEDQAGSCCWCCYHPWLMTFICGVVIITFLGGCALWEFGILQPILSQCVVYIYVMLVLVAFVALIVSRLWTLCRRLIDFIIAEFQRMKDAFRIFPRRHHRFARSQEHRRFGFFEDDLNTTAAPPNVALGPLGQRKLARAKARKQ